MIVNKVHSVQESCNLDCIIIEIISYLVKQIVLWTNTFYTFKQITFTTTKEKVDYHLTHHWP